MFIKQFPPTKKSTTSNKKTNRLNQVLLVYSFKWFNKLDVVLNYFNSKHPARVMKIKKTRINNLCFIKFITLFEKKTCISDKPDL